METNQPLISLLDIPLTCGIIQYMWNNTVKTTPIWIIYLNMCSRFCVISLITIHYHCDIWNIIVVTLEFTSHADMHYECMQYSDSINQEACSIQTVSTRRHAVFRQYQQGSMQYFRNKPPSFIKRDQQRQRTWLACKV